MIIFRSERIDDWKKGREQIELLKKKNKRTLIIHYSCESFFNLNGRTPRVTTICVKNRGNNTTKTFSIHIQAQIVKKELCCITDSDYDQLEKSMLKEFFKYLKSHLTYYWVHWNMKNLSFGFEAIANRCKILGGYPREIEDQFKIDLQDVLGRIYTFNFEKHEPNGQLLNLAQRNKISTRDALKGKDEATAFENREYLKLQMSTCRKVDIIDRILTLEEKRYLKVNISKYKIYGITPIGIYELIKNSPVLLIIWSILIYLAGSAFEPLIQKFFGTN
jgi:hypothetical protein